MVSPGTPVSTTQAPHPSKNITLVGKHVTIVGISPTHAPAMFAQTGGLHHSSLFEHLFDGPYETLEQYTADLKTKAADQSTFFYTILLNDGSEPGKPVGRYALMRVDTASRVLEIGHILFSPLLQRTPAATEAVYLLMEYAFEDLGYRRIEWKCNSLNEPSKRAALRLGFVFEGLFRQHMIQRGCSRDTCWYSVVDEEWERVKGAMRKWLDEENFDREGKQKRKLEEIRETMIV